MIGRSPVELGLGWMKLAIESLTATNNKTVYLLSDCT
jgi:hypothetical protein